LACAIIIGALAALVRVKPAEAAPIVLHGATIAKGCNSPKSPGDTTDCSIQVGYNDQGGDTISVDEVWDVEDFGTDNVRVPAVGNLQIIAVSGNTTCVVAGALPCKIGPSGSVLNGLPGTGSNGSVTFQSNTYTIQNNDADPLPDQGNAKVHDLCDSPTTSGCNSASNTIQFTSQTDLVFTPSVVTEIHNAAHGVITSVAAGTAVHDKVTVSSTHGTPTGTVDFNRYATIDCTGAAVAESSGVALVAGVAESTGFTPSSPGALSYKAHFNGDGNFVATDGDCEPLTIDKLTPNITTQIHNPAHTDITGTTVNEGTIVHDKALVSGSGAIPTGTVDFQRFTNNSCSGSPANVQSGVALNSASSPANAESNTFSTVAGDLSYLVHYNGDNEYAAGDAICEVLTVQAAPQGCTLTQGFWKNHASAWPVSSLTLGTVSYTKTQLITILKTPVKGNGLISMSHQLIAAKLNIASGASDAAIASTIAAADALIGSKVVPPIGTDKIAPSVTSSLNDALDNFNSGITGPGHCSE
jgi:hypothetical protein